MARSQILVMPCAFDALSARLIERAGYEACFLSGAAVAASQLGMPDVGLLTMTEVVAQARRMASALGIPLIADADTGYGNAVNVMRTVRELERAGVAGLMLEDQATPKRCGHFEGKQVIARDEMEGKVAAAVEARRDGDLVLIARTDARGPLGLDEAIARGRAYHKAGADAIFVEAPQSVEELREVGRALAGVPLMANMAEGGKTPQVPVGELQAMGFRLVVFPLTALLAAIRAMRGVLAELKAAGTAAGYLDRLASWEEFQALVRKGEVDRLEERFLRA
jgi:methylisocitrate lyase